MAKWPPAALFSEHRRAAMVVVTWRSTYQPRVGKGQPWRSSASRVRLLHLVAVARGVMSAHDTSGPPARVRFHALILLVRSCIHSTLRVQ